MSNTSAGETEIGARTVRKIMMRVLPISGLLYMFHTMDKSNISFAQFGMSGDLGITLSVFGTAAGIMAVGYLIFEVPSNIALKKFGARRWIARIAISWGLVTILTGFVQNIPQLYIARVLLGAAEAGLFPGLMLYFTFWFRPQERGLAIATLVLAQPFAFIVGSLSGGFILDHVYWFDMASWRWIFILQGILTVLIGILVLFILPSTPQQAGFLTTDEKDWICGEIESSASLDDGAEPESLRIQLRALTSRTVLHLGLINLLAAVGLIGFGAFAPLIIRQMNPGYSATSVGIVGVIPYLAGAIGLVLVGRSSDRCNERRNHVFSLMVLGAVGMLGTIRLMAYPTLGLICLSMVSIAVFGYISPFWALATQVLSKANAVVGLAMINSIATIGFFLGPVIVGRGAVGDDVSGGLYFPVICFVLAAVLVALVKVPRRDQTRNILESKADLSSL